MPRQNAAIFQIFHLCLTLQVTFFNHQLFHCLHNVMLLQHNPANLRLWPSLHVDVMERGLCQVFKANSKSIDLIVLLDQHLVQHKCLCSFVCAKLCFSSCLKNVERHMHQGHSTRTHCKFSIFGPQIVLCCKFPQ